MGMFSLNTNISKERSIFYFRQLRDSIDSLYPAYYSFRLIKGLYKKYQLNFLWLLTTTISIIIRKIKKSIKWIIKRWIN